MLQSMGLQRVEHDFVTEQQGRKKRDAYFIIQGFKGNWYVRLSR